MNSLQKRIDQITNSLGENCRLVAVSKTKPVTLLQEAFDLGLRVFGENKVQEMTTKYETLPKEIEWHMIGHLQTNKVKYIAPFVAMIHSVDSLKLLKEINKRAAQSERVIDCLLQIHIAKEETKFGFSEQELVDLLSGSQILEYQNVRICGVMGMATNTNDSEQVRDEFKELKSIFDRCKEKYKGANLYWKELSMGMSGDYPIAVEEGSTLVRIGSAVFGARDYNNQ